MEQEERDRLTVIEKKKETRCNNCNKIYTYFLSSCKGKYCCYKCFKEALKKGDFKFKSMLGSHRSKETCKRISIALKNSVLHQERLKILHEQNKGRPSKKKGRSGFKSKPCSGEQRKLLSELRKGNKNPSWNGGLRKTQCKVCGNNFYVIKSRFEHQGRGLFCSRSCKGIWWTRHLKRKDTALEIKVENLLKELNINFDKQKVIREAKTIVDFYIPKQRIVIYVDGEYWHSKPHIKERDIRQEKDLKTNGYKVLRVLEKQLKDRKWIRNLEQIQMELPSV